MAIFATKVGADRSSSGLSLKLSEPIPDGSILVYDSHKQAFVNVQATGLVPVSGAINLGGNHVIGPYADNFAGMLQFKQFIAGSGIAISTDEDSITFSSISTDSNMSVDGSYNITIDNQNDKRNSVFEITTIVSSPPLVVRPLLPNILNIGALFSGNNTEGQGYFQLQNSPTSFDQMGLTVGMWIVVGDAGNQSGTFQIERINDYTTNNVVYSELIVSQFDGNQGFNLGGPKPNVTIEPVDLYISDYYTLSSYSLDFSLGFTRGTIFTIEGSDLNDGTYKVLSVHPKGNTPYDQSFITLDPSTPFVTQNGGLLGTVTVTAIEVEVPTGFTVGKQGHVTATDITAVSVASNTMTVGSPAKGSYSLNNPNDVVRNDNLDPLTRITAKSRTYFMSFL